MTTLVSRSCMAPCGLRSASHFSPLHTQDVVTTPVLPLYRSREPEMRSCRRLAGAGRKINSGSLIKHRGALSPHHRSAQREHSLHAVSAAPGSN